MLMIRLQRVGRKNDPSYRVVVTEKQNAAKSGKFLEVVGSYDARKDRRLFNAERIRHFISHGAQPLWNQTLFPKLPQKLSKKLYQK